MDSTVCMANVRLSAFRPGLLFRVGLWDLGVRVSCIYFSLFFGPGRRGGVVGG